MVRIELVELQGLCCGVSLCYFSPALFPFLTSRLNCPCSSASAVEKKKKLLEKIEEQLLKLNVQATDKEENKQIALGTSKLNYLDPRISVAW